MDSLVPVPTTDVRSLRVAGLFAGIGGIERGMHRAGHDTVLLCEIDDPALTVLQARFPHVPSFLKDVHEVSDLAGADLVAAGFPCQDLSQAGRTAGIRGEQSGLVGEVFRLLRDPSTAPKWLMLENVPFMLQLEQGRAMRYLTDELGQLGYRWAYRVVDARAFGLPQRRRRVILLASRTEDPRPVLLAEDAAEVEQPLRDDSVCGFYWTEGLRGLGWAVDAIPTLKGGSGLGIPSPPAMWVRAQRLPLHTPGIRDAERLQGFPADWTAAASEAGGRGARWKLVGNAVSVPVAEWVGDRLRYDRGRWDDDDLTEQPVERRWPIAAWGESDRAFAVPVSSWPRRERLRRLGEFIEHETAPLSHRAASGFYERTQRSGLRFVDGFLDAVRQHIASTAA
jgi:DNA (cytosine-5)-methyltransferase 1